MVQANHSYRVGLPDPYGGESKAIVQFTLTEMPGCCGITVISRLMAYSLDSDNLAVWINDRSWLSGVMKSFSELMLTYDLYDIMGHGHPQISCVQNGGWFPTTDTGAFPSAIRYLLKTNNILFTGIGLKHTDDLYSNTYELSLLAGATELSKSVNPRTGRTVYITQLKRNEEK